MTTQERWRAHVDAWKSSGLSSRAYAAKAGVNQRTLTWWKSKLASAGATEQLAAPAADAGVIELDVGGVHVQVRGRVEAEALALARARRAGGAPMIPTSVRIFVCTQPLDMRRSFDGLAAAAKQMLGEDPRSGALFMFTNRRSNRLKVLWWDKNGYCLLCKRLHQALFRLPSANDPSDRSGAPGGPGG
ncbi:IS66 family insertion sequence element accessory protein TnpB [Nannocystis bainbridge]|uniref:IS66 family insertion sequence element accessory protein TnpB n=1 Tax=Nannocystis bainbridge TaxID=2995303 RepID=A0ABT5DR57_9BACT|nr:IS66 family insertion sequence element accessory protein TnpB [Nannocystis bainbridge]MDC0716142.1 IS66 family insertion sequence element accessory protein TnpB [Nannocystis bainbridge]